ncbi:MAG: TIGR02206 family membrane protein [Bacteroidia bacterium]|nr:TIGR02206 family membrane protein [Bacteroidia bacterium]MBT8230579.1 TIGR02206 family membrane protein [Bacteroidia bacterium]
MDLSFFFDQSEFTPWTRAHGLPILIIALAGLISIIYGLNVKDRKRKKQILFYLSLVPAQATLFNILFPLIEGDFNIHEDLPFHVCRFAALIAPFVIWKESKFWMGILYFWILAGTLNANITPDVQYGFPHWSYFEYWLLHSFLVILPLYYVIVLKIKIQFRDLTNAFWGANVFLIFTLLINISIGSNYMYSRAKPPVPSLLDLMGPWPTYLLTGQLLAGVLFFILYLPFYFRRIPHGTGKMP